MAKLFEFDPEYGLVNKIGGTAITNTNSIFKKTDKGLSAYCFTNAKLAIGNIGNLKSVAFFIKFNSTSEKIFEGDPNEHLIYSNAGTLTYPDWDNAFVDTIDTDTVVANKWYCVVITSTTNVNCGAIILALNNATYGNIWIKKAYGFDTELTTAEILNLQKEFLNLKPLSISKRNFFYPKPKELKETGLVAAYNFKLC